MVFDGEGDCDDHHPIQHSIHSWPYVYEGGYCQRQVEKNNRQQHHVQSSDQSLEMEGVGKVSCGEHLQTQCRLDANKGGCTQRQVERKSNKQHDLQYSDQGWAV